MTKEAVEKGQVIPTRMAERAERVGHRLDELSAEAQDLVERGKERALVARDNLTSYVQDRPMKSVLIAAGVGLFLGAILSRR
jgi:ElaB/YqjD/DUF883 family membrane-anchored ribosome-binding protein